jgi:hypothetical protein
MHRRYFVAGSLSLILGFCSHSRAAYAQVVNTNYSEAIEQVLKQDKRNFNKLKAETDSRGIDALQDYITAFENVDLRGCPPDFQDAFLRHAEAWSELLFVKRRVEAKYGGFWGGVNAFLDGWNNDFKDYENKFDQELQQATSEVRDTWHEVKLIALKYGANTAMVN